MLIIPGVLSCRSNADERLFDGPIIVVEESERTIQLHGEHIYMDIPSTPVFCVHDSIIMFYQSSSMSDAAFTLANTRTGKSFGEFCPYGRGPNEAAEYSYFLDFFEENGNQYCMAYAYNDKKSLRKWNITESIKQGKTVFDTVFSLATRNKFMNAFKLEQGLLMYSLPMHLTLDRRQISNPFIELWSADGDSLIRRFDLFKEEIPTNTSSPYSESAYLLTANCVKPDGKQIAMAMYALPQINIMDLESGKQIGYRLGRKPDFSLFYKNMSNAIFYSYRAFADDKYIYTLNGAKPEKGQVQKDLLPTLYVFDWEGNNVCKCNFGQKVIRAAFDSKSGLLYCMDEQWEIYRYDLKQIES